MIIPEGTIPTTATPKVHPIPSREIKIGMTEEATMEVRGATMDPKEAMEDKTDKGDTEVRTGKEAMEVRTDKEDTEDKTDKEAMEARTGKEDSGVKIDKEDRGATLEESSIQTMTGFKVSCAETIT